MQDISNLNGNQAKLTIIIVKTSQGKERKDNECKKEIPTAYEPRREGNRFNVQQKYQGGKILLGSKGRKGNHKRFARHIGRRIKRIVMLTTGKSNKTPYNTNSSAHDHKKKGNINPLFATESTP